MEEHRLIGKRLEEVRGLILKMSAEAQTAVERSMQAVVERDSNIAAEVLAHDDAIDNLELDIDREVIEIFALLQPAARDLRFVISIRDPYAWAVSLGWFLGWAPRGEMLPDERASEQHFVARAPVRIGAVEEADAEIERSRDRLVELRLERLAVPDRRGAAALTDG